MIRLSRSRDRSVCLCLCLCFCLFLVLLMSSCVVVPYPVSSDVRRLDDAELNDRLYIHVGPRGLLERVSERIVAETPDIEVIDPMLFRDTAFPEGGWSLHELLKEGRCQQISSNLDVQFLVLLTPLKFKEGEEQGFFIPLAFGAMAFPEESTLSALIVDLRSGSFLCRLDAASSGSARMLYYVIYIAAADPMTESAVIRDLSEAIGKAISEEMDAEPVRIAVLAASVRNQTPDYAGVSAAKLDLDLISATYPQYCTSMSDDTSPKQILDVGDVLFSNRNYNEAYICFDRVVKSQVAEEVTIQQASEKLAIMYELGWGVEADWEQAKYWYRRAGTSLEFHP